MAFQAAADRHCHMESFSKPQNRRWCSKKKPHNHGSSRAIGELWHLQITPEGGSVASQSHAQSYTKPGPLDPGKLMASVSHLKWESHADKNKLHGGIRVPNRIGVAFRRHRQKYKGGIQKATANEVCQDLATCPGLLAAG